LVSLNLFLKCQKKCFSCSVLLVADIFGTILAQTFFMFRCPERINMGPISQLMLNSCFMDDDGNIAFRSLVLLLESNER
jgi:spore germination protein GerM